MLLTAIYDCDIHDYHAGMDPVARRFMWRVLSGLSAQGGGRVSLVLTTHSMVRAWTGLNCSAHSHFESDCALMQSSLLRFPCSAV